jgi:hypothetical protein
VAERHAQAWWPGSEHDHACVDSKQFFNNLATSAIVKDFIFNTKSGGSPSWMLTELSSGIPEQTEGAYWSNWIACL